MSDSEIQKDDAKPDEATKGDPADERAEDIKLLEAELDKVKAEAEDFKKKYYYLAAEIENGRRRFEREKENLLKYGNEKVLSGLIEVVDNLERTLAAVGKDEDQKVKNIVIGIDMVKSQFLNILGQNGLTQVEAVGKTFDPNFHEAMAQQKVEGKPDHEIICEYQKGYVLNGRLLRASKVVVAKNEE